MVPGFPWPKLYENTGLSDMNLFLPWLLHYSKEMLEDRVCALHLNTVSQEKDASELNRPFTRAISFGATYNAFVGISSFM